MAQRQKKGAGPLHGSLIEDYCMIGDCETAALVSREGSIDWLCWPNFSSAACFAALLGTRDHGYWKIAPAGKVKAIMRQYEAHTLVVETTFETKEGEVCLVDFMPLRAKHSHVVRMVRGVRGKVAMELDLALRFDYGRTIPWVTSSERELHAVAGSDMVVLQSDVLLRGEGMATHSEFTVRAGETVSFTLTNLSSLEEGAAGAACRGGVEGDAGFLEEVEWEEPISGSVYGGGRAVADDVEGDDV